MMMITRLLADWGMSAIRDEMKCSSPLDVSTVWVEVAVSLYAVGNESSWPSTCDDQTWRFIEMDSSTLLHTSDVELCAYSCHWKVHYSPEYEHWFNPRHSWWISAFFCAATWHLTDTGNMYIFIIGKRAIICLVLFLCITSYNVLFDMLYVWLCCDYRGQPAVFLLLRIPLILWCLS